MIVISFLINLPMVFSIDQLFHRSRRRSRVVMVCLTHSVELKDTQFVRNTGEYLYLLAGATEFGIFVFKNDFDSGGRSDPLRKSTNTTI